MTLHVWWRRILAPVALILLAGSLWAASLLICPKCGTEADASATVCPHCGAPLPVTQVVTPAPIPAPPAPAQKQKALISDLALEALHTDSRLADENLAVRPELSCCYYENALALGRLVNREGLSADAGKTLAGNLEKCRSLQTQTQRTCPGCNGTGKYSMQLRSLAGDKSLQVGAPALATDGTACSVCGGRGVVAGGRSVDELRVLMAQGRRDFDARQQAIGRVACGRVWVPANLMVLLDVKAQALVRTTYPTPCAGCMGSGIQDCTHCKGAGRIKCSNDGCVNGWVTVKEPNAFASKTPLTHKERCTICQGTGLMPCPDCHAQGTTPCKTCSGSGRNAVCPDCGGQGFGPCPKCQGTGHNGSAVCPECQGKGERLCPKCHGEGCAVK